MTSEPIDVRCNAHQNINCAIKLNGVFCDGYSEEYDKKHSIGVFSHFHEDHIAAVTECIGAYDVLIAHPITFRGITALKPGIKYREQWVSQDFDTEYVIPHGKLRLLKANHIPGSSQVYVETSDQTMLYSGDFGFPGVQIKHADYLVLDATHGDPWHDGKTDRNSVKNRLFEDVEFLTNSNKSMVILVSTGTLQEIIRHFEVAYGRKLPSDVHFVMDEKQQAVLHSIYADEKNEFRDIVVYNSREFWSLVRNNKKYVVFYTGSILDNDLRNLYKIIIDKYRFSQNKSSIQLFEGGCRYNLSAHASIDGIYSYIEAVNPKYVITDYSRSKFARQLAKMIGQKFPKIKATCRPPQFDT